MVYTSSDVLFSLKILVKSKKKVFVVRDEASYFLRGPHFPRGSGLQPAQPIPKSSSEWTPAILSNRGIFSTTIIYLQLTKVHQLHVLHISIKTWFANKVVVFFIATSTCFVGPSQAFWSTESIRHFLTVSNTSHYGN